MNTAHLPPLVQNEVHVWRIATSRLMGEIQSLRETLSADELERANSYHFEHDRQCFIIARGILRRLIARYTDSQPQHLNFQYNSYGKPRLVADTKHNQLNFNLSHSGGLIGLVFALDIAVGIDVEKVREDLDFLEIATHIFSERENNKLHGFHPARRRDAFFRCWTRKEAYIKGHGQGLSMPLKDFDVRLGKFDQPILSATRHDRNAVFHWSIADLDLASGYIGALAIERPKCIFKYCQ